MASYYSRKIAKLAPDYDAGEVEAFMRAQHSTLDRLSPSEFLREVRISCQCIDEAPDMARRLAESFGL